MGGLEKKKLWTGVIGVPPLIVVILWGPAFVLFLLVFAATLLGLREFYRLTLPRSRNIERFFGFGLALLLSVFLSFGTLRMLPLFVALILLILLVLFMALSQNTASTISELGISLFGILYIAFLLSYVSLIRKLPEGKTWVLFLIATVWAGDIAAFSGGSLFGRHKLYPKISPKKTYEGLFGGILGAAGVAVIFTLLVLPGMKVAVSALIAIGIGVFGQLGDFSESMLKRSAQVKDSGHLIPGHGGMLDRLDSFLFSSPFLYYSLAYLFKESV